MNHEGVVKLIETNDVKAVEAREMRLGQTGIVTDSESPLCIPVGSLVMRAATGMLVALDLSRAYSLSSLGLVYVRPHAPGKRLVFETV